MSEKDCKDCILVVSRDSLCCRITYIRSISASNLCIDCIVASLVCDYVATDICFLCFIFLCFVSALSAILSCGLLLCIQMCIICVAQSCYSVYLVETSSFHPTLSLSVQLSVGKSCQARHETHIHICTLNSCLWSCLFTWNLGPFQTVYIRLYTHFTTLS